MIISQKACSIPGSLGIDPLLSIASLNQSLFLQSQLVEEYKTISQKRITSLLLWRQNHLSERLQPLWCIMGLTPMCFSCQAKDRGLCSIKNYCIFCQVWSINPWSQFSIHLQKSLTNNRKKLKADVTTYSLGILISFNEGDMDSDKLSLTSLHPKKGEICYVNASNFPCSQLM